MKRLIILTFAALSVCFGRAQKVDVAFYAGAAPLSGTAAAQAASGRTFAHWWYVRDRLGSVRTVLDDDGTIRQCAMFYPSGVPVQLFGTQRVTDRAHIGNRRSNFAGLGRHDNIARWHDAIKRDSADGNIKKCIA